MGNEQSRLTEEQKEAIREAGYRDRDREIVAGKARKEAEAGIKTSTVEVPERNDSVADSPLFVKDEPQDRTHITPEPATRRSPPRQPAGHPPSTSVAPPRVDTLAVRGVDGNRRISPDSRPDTSREAISPTAATTSNTLKRPIISNDRTNIKRVNTSPIEPSQRTIPTTERQSSLPTISRRPAASAATGAINSTTTTVGGTGSSTQNDTSRPPLWYKNTPRPTNRTGTDSAVDMLLGSLKDRIVTCTKKALDPAAFTAQQKAMRQLLQRAAFAKVTGKLLRGNRMLDNDTGLPAIFDPTLNPRVSFDWDIRADAKELYTKWASQDFDGDLLRGLELGRKDGRTSDHLDKNYAHRIDPKYFGAGQLTNGQWWPTQLATLRDGAHGSSQGGISGTMGEGAHSCILSGGAGSYDDEDHGDWVLYCGTDSTDGTITAPTRLMLANVASRRPVRFIRSHNIPRSKSAWAPEEGFRYDGLYTVEAVASQDPPGSVRQRHRFRLVRCPGQDPIRGGDMVGSRPNVVEIEEYRKDKRLRKG